MALIKADGINGLREEKIVGVEIEAKFIAEIYAALTT
jgi:hypothetical protein